MTTTLNSPNNHIHPSENLTNRNSTEAYSNSAHDQYLDPIAKHYRMKTTLHKVIAPPSQEESQTPTVYRPLDEINGSLS